MCWLWGFGAPTALLAGFLKEVADEAFIDEGFSIDDLAANLEGVAAAAPFKDCKTECQKRIPCCP
jgi:hypothetical protein